MKQTQSNQSLSNMVYKAIQDQIFREIIKLLYGPDLSTQITSYTKLELSAVSISGMGSLIPVSLCEISFLGSGMETWYVVLNCQLFFKADSVSGREVISKPRSETVVVKGNKVMLQNKQ